MPTRDYVKLFQKSGTEANLRYLWSRLAEHDLSQSEALAMVSAVHRELGQSEADDPRLYVSYARFMGSLQRDLPAVHQHVVKTWSQSRHPVRPQPAPARRQETAVIEGETLESPVAAPRPLADTGLRRFIRAVQQDVGGGEGPEEPGEPDEDDHEPGVAEREPQGGAAAEPEDDEDPDEDDDPDPESHEKTEARAEEVEPDDTDEWGEASEAHEVEPEEADDAEDARSEDAQEEDPDAEEGQEAEAVEADESESDSGSGEVRADVDGSAAEEIEWPAEEQPEAAEGLEEFEGEASEAPPAE